MDDRQFEVRLPAQGWWLPGLCALAVVFSLIVLVRGVVAVGWDSESTTILAITAVLAGCVWTTRPLRLGIDVTVRGIARTEMPGYHDRLYRAAFDLHWRDLQSWRLVIVSDDEGTTEFVELIDTTGVCYRQDRLATELSEELRRRVPEKECPSDPIHAAEPRVS